MSNKTRTAKRYSSVGWRTGGWTLPPSMMTSAPSTGEHGVERWIASLGASLANPSASPDDARARTTAATSGRPLDAALLRYDPSSSFWRTSQVSFSQSEDGSPTLSRYCLSLPGWVTWDRRALWAQETPERPTAETDGSAWPTPGSSPRGPTAEDLIVDGKMEVQRRESGQQRGMDLQTATTYWSTPKSQDSHGGSGQNVQGGPSLTDQIAWATPTTRDHKDGANPSALAPTNGLLGRQAPRTAMPGPESSPSDPTSRRRLMED
jgi:hypothetical protein